MASRLRTHCGGPAQTLAALEHALQAAVVQLQQEKQGPAGNASTASEAGNSDRRRAAVLLLLFLHALEQGIAAAASGGGSSRAAAPQAATTFFAANDKVGRLVKLLMTGPCLTCHMLIYLCSDLQVCQAWFARVRPALVRAAAAAQLHDLAVYHAILRLQALQQHTQTLLPAAAAPAAPVAAEASSESAAGIAEPAVAATRAPLAGKQRRISGGEGSVGDAANPAAALLAATRGSPSTALLQQPPGSPAAAAHGRQPSQLQVQQAAGKVAEVAAAAAAALCALGDAQGVAGLQAYCRQAFQPLLEQLHHKREAMAADANPAAGAAVAAWDWLAAVQEQAAGRYESAIQRYCQLYGPAAPASTMQCVPAAALARLVAEAYAAVGDAAGLKAWLQVSVRRRACFVHCPRPPSTLATKTN